MANLELNDGQPQNLEELKLESRNSIGIPLHCLSPEELALLIDEQEGSIWEQHRKN